MKKVTKLIAMVAVCFAAAFAQASLFTWTGGANNNWSNTANWAGGALPVVNATNELAGSTNAIRITAGTFAPTVGVPNYVVDAGTGALGITTPPNFIIDANAALSVTSSASINLRGGSTNSVGTGGTLSMGAGAGTAGQFNLIRSTAAGARQIFDVNGTLNLYAGGKLIIGYSTAALTTINLNGGTLNAYANGVYGANTLTTDFTANKSTINLTNGSVFNAATTLNQMEGTFNAGSDPTLVFDIQDTNSTVTAVFGGSFTNLASVTNGIGTYFRSTTGVQLTALDNGNGTFTVTTIPEPATIGMLGLGALVVILIRRAR